jgi:hypothetical protein
MYWVSKEELDGVYHKVRAKITKKDRYLLAASYPNTFSLNIHAMNLKSYEETA